MENNKKVNNTARFIRALHYSSKIEMVLRDLFANLSLISIIDIFVWLISLAIYFISGVQIRLIWFQIVHLLRGLVCWRISTLLPRSSGIIDEMRTDLQNPNVDFYEMFKMHADKILDRTFRGKINFFLFFLLFCLCVSVDIVSLIYVVDMLQDSDDPTSDIQKNQLEYLEFLFSIILYLFADFIVLIWESSLVFHFPKVMGVLIKNIMMGIVAEAKKFGSNVKDFKNETKTIEGAEYDKVRKDKPEEKVRETKEIDLEKQNEVKQPYLESEVKMEEIEMNDMEDMFNN